MNSLRRRPVDLAGVLAGFVDEKDDDDDSLRKNPTLASVLSPRRENPRSNEKKIHRHSRRLVSRRARISGRVGIFMLMCASSLWMFSFRVRYNYPQQQHLQEHWIAHVRSTLKLLLSGNRNSDNCDRNRKQRHAVRIPTTVVFSLRTSKRSSSSWSFVQMPLDDWINNDNADGDARARSPDFGNLTVSSSSSSLSPFARSISEQDYEDFEMFCSHSLQAMDTAKPNLPPKLWHVDELWTTVTVTADTHNTSSLSSSSQAHKRQCYPNNWGRTNAKPVCNAVHEMRTMDRPYSPTEVDQELQIQYQTSGYYRDVWIMERPSSSSGTDSHRPSYAHASSFTTSSTTPANPASIAVLKKYQLQDYFPLAEHALHQVQKEAIILERLSASDRIIDIHGYCGISLLIEAAKGDVVSEMVSPAAGGGYMQQSDLNRIQMDDVQPMNNLTLTEKLDTALVMAESLADIHGCKGGVIAHGDVHPEQWLRTLDGKLKLNDFGLAEILDFDPWNRTYCNVYRCYSGYYHAPEELKCVRGNEALDVYSMGNNIYVLLTGLWPYYTAETEFDERVVGKKVKKGIRPYVDERYRHRSVVEQRMVEIMEQCWEIDFEKRVSIFDVVRQLDDLRKWHAAVLERPQVQFQ
jgi:hypothetical protein